MINTIYLLIIVVLLVILAATLREEKRSKPAQRYSIEQFWKGEDRREFRRISGTLQVDYTYLSPDGKKVEREKKDTRSVSQNISWGGIQLLLPEKLKEGAWLSLEVYLEENRPPIHAMGKVVWAEEAADATDAEGTRLFRTGVKFQEFSSHSQDKLIKFLYETSSSVGELLR